MHIHYRVHDTIAQLLYMFVKTKKIVEDLCVGVVGNAGAWGIAVPTHLLGFGGDA